LLKIERKKRKWPPKGKVKKEKLRGNTYQKKAPQRRIEHSKNSLNPGEKTTKESYNGTAKGGKGEKLRLRVKGSHVP